MPRDPVALTLTLETPGGCVSYRRAGATLAAVEAQIPALLRAAQAEHATATMRHRASIAARLFQRTPHPVGDEPC